MATFPALTPSDAPITPGAWPATAHKSLNGAESSIRHGSAEIRRTWRPTFVNITEANFLAILSHYRGQRSGFDSFGFTTTTLAADLTPAGFAWLYASRPQVVDQHADCFTVQCEFRCEPRGLVVAPGKAWRTGATTFTPGSRTGGIVYGPSVAWVTPSTTFAPGDRLGFYGGANGVSWATAATTFAPGSRSASASVSLLLHMDGSNGSTTFTDSSSNAHAMTVNLGTVTISTTDSKFGGASAYFVNGDLRTPSSSTFTFSGDFTVELWAKRTGTTGEYDTLITATAGEENLFMIRASTDNPGVFINGIQFATGIALTLDTWRHIAVVRSGSTVTAYLDGVSIGTTTTSGTITCGRLCIGNSFQVNNRFFKGYVDELRVSKDNARYTENFKP